MFSPKAVNNPTTNENIVDKYEGKLNDINARATNSSVNSEMIPNTA